METNKILIHIPHSSTYIPPSERACFLLSDAELEHELLLMTDRYTDDLFDIDHCEKQINGVSRLVMDPERFRNDTDEEMSRCGMGAVYTRTSAGKPLKIESLEQKNFILMNYYDLYHAQFTDRVAKIVSLQDQCLIIDAHSFPSKPLPYEKDQSSDRPDICIGYDDFHAPESLIKAVTKFFSYEGLKVAENRPFAGSIVPSRFYKKDNRVSSIMIEINRTLYMDETSGLKNAGYDKVKDVIKRLLCQI